MRDDIRGCVSTPYVGLAGSKEDQRSGFLVVGAIVACGGSLRAAPRGVPFAS